MAAIGWSYLIFWLLVSPDPPTGGASSFLSFLGRPDLFAHAALFGGLAFFLRIWIGSIKLCKPFSVTLRYFMPVLFAGIYGAALELVQRGVAGRSADPWDAVLDTWGAIIAVAFVGLWLQVRKGRAQDRKNAEA